MSTIRATYIQHGSSAVPNITLNASGDVVIASGITVTGSITASGFVSSSSVVIPSGSAAAPGIYFAGDTDTGLFTASGNTIAVTTSGTERLRVDDGGRLLVGTSSTSKQTRALVQGNSGGGATAELILAADTSSPTGGVGNIYFSDNSHNTAAIIACVRDGGTWTSGSSHPNSLQFYTTADGAGSPTERMRITNEGFAKFSNTGSYLNSNGLWNEFNSDEATYPSLVCRNTSGTFTNNLFQVRSVKAGNSDFSLGSFRSSDGVDIEFNFRGDGNAYADGSWNGGGADYAEYFEWSDSNPDEEDRRGISVVLDGEKIRPAVDGEDPIGVISGNPSVVGDSAWNKWNGKYLRDEFGTYIQEDYEAEDEDGNIVIQQRRKLNPAYDPDVEYISREQRPEWDCVGLMGKLRIRKGQPTGSRWIKMRDISDSVEEWLVR